MNRKLYNDENYIVSEEFGRTFWFDTNNELMSAPTFKKVDLINLNLIMFQSGQSGKESTILNYLR